MSNREATLTDFISDYIESGFSVRPDMLDSIAPKIRLAVIELQKENMLPPITIAFESKDMKDEKRDAAGKLIYNFYTLPKDFRTMKPDGPAFEVLGSNKRYTFMDYGTFIRNYNTSSKYLFTIHRFNNEHGPRNRLIVDPFPKDTDTVEFTYFPNGVDTEMDTIDRDYYMPIINHVLFQMGLKDKSGYKDGVNQIKRDRNDPAGQGSHHDSFTQTKPRFFGKHRP